MADNVLKSFLVRLGFSVDESSFNGALNKVNNFSSLARAATSKLASNFVSASDIMFSYATKAATSIYEIVDATVKADEATKQMSKEMMISESSARAYSTALNSLGLKQSDLLYLSDEQYKRLIRMNEFNKTLEAPADVNNTLEKIRSIQEEFAKLKSMLSYIKRWFVYYLGKYFGTQLDQIHNKFKNFTTFIKGNLQPIAEKAAKVISIVGRLLISGYNAAEKFITYIYKFIKEFPSALTGMLVALSPLFAKFLLSPIGLVTAALVFLLGLIDDYETWERGGESYFGDRWQKVQDVLSGFGDDGGGILTVFRELGKAVEELFKAIFNLKNTDEVFDFLAKSLSAVLSTVTAFTDFIFAATGNFDKISDDSILSGDAARTIYKFFNPGSDTSDNEYSTADPNSIVALKRFKQIYGYEPSGTEQMSWAIEHMSPAERRKLGIGFSVEDEVINRDFSSGGWFENIARWFLDNPYKTGSNSKTNNNNISVTVNGDVNNPELMGTVIGETITSRQNEPIMG